ncbi:MAG TPA: hypothetical protein VE174_01030 [Actinomycetota bacterium]|nr:hypothetical protein [Actinomycetota bacterium]
MPDRFSDLSHYLPPPPGRSDEDRPGGLDPSNERIPTPRPRFTLPTGWSRLTVLLTALVVAAAASGALAARLSMIEPPPEAGSVQHMRVAAAPPDPAPARGDVRATRVLGIREHRPPRRSKPTKPPRRQRRRTTQRTSVPAAPVTVAAPAASEARRERRKPRQKPRPQRRTRPEPIPAPPGTPLFDCYSGEKVDHFITTDRASAGQAETSRGKYQCAVVGYVYAYPAPNTQAIEVDAGAAYVFADDDARTEPACQKEALYRHETGYDFWYSTDQADQGFVGYMKP